MGNNIFSVRLRQALDVSEMKLSELSDKTGINKGTLSHYLSGTYVPKQNRTYIIAKALNTSVAWLMGADVPMKDDMDNTLTDSLADTLGELIFDKQLSECMVKLGKLNESDKNTVCVLVDSLYSKSFPGEQ